ncbi:hypothetical protein HYQ44_009317 [Verticillium longisporum]|nr:hypothetical protein HYQ44_009317 [Verticillium longisporum]
MLRFTVTSQITTLSTALPKDRPSPPWLRRPLGGSGKRKSSLIQVSAADKRLWRRHSPAEVGGGRITAT